MSARSIANSSTSKSSRNSSKYSVKYRTKSHTSHVDDMLFGDSHASKVMKSRANKPLETTEVLHFTNDHNKPCNKQMKSKKPETVRVITKDLIRDVVVRSNDTNSAPVILSGKKYGQILGHLDGNDNSHLRQVKSRDQIHKEMQERKEIFNEYDLKRAEKKPLNDLETESRTQAEELKKRSTALRLEDNDEIKHLNELILEAKCHAIRDAQIEEKLKLKDELKEEEDRLDAMMEIDRINAIKQQEEIVVNRKQLRQQGAEQIMHQIEANRLQALFDAERKDMEARMLVDKQKEMQLQDLAEIEAKRNFQRQLQEEINQINKDDKLQKIRRIEEEKLADLRVHEYQKAKALREEREEEEKKRGVAEKELEIAKLRAAQEKFADLQAEKDALRAKRHEEATEREYRQKMREEAAKKHAINAEMKLAREEQIDSKRHSMALQAARERAEFDRVLAEQQKEVAAMAKADQLKHQGQIRYASEVRQQIKDREEQRINERKAFFNETIQLDQDILNKNKQLEDVKRGKLAQLKDSGVPEKYVMEVARRIGLQSVN